MPTPPPGLWSDLQQDLPVALVPVRLETRYGTRDETLPDGSLLPIPVLRVRIYPDDISVATSSPGLTTVDKEAGADFWTEQTAPETDDEKLVPGTLEHRRRAAWEVLARRVGPTRTAYVAGATRPGAGPTPDQDQQAATAVLLPDSWVVIGELDGQQVFAEHVTRATADLQVGPSRDQGRDAFDPDDPHLLHPDDGLRWATDFDAAVAIGMAAVIDLATVQQVQAGQQSAAATRGLDSLIVVGARAPDAERTPEKEADAFAGLLSAHARTDKVALVAQGTPTNNLTDQPSGWTSTGDVYAGYEQVVDPQGAPAAFSEVSALRGGASDGATLEAALGLPAAITAAWDGAARREQWLARNMALALFPATIGEVVGTLGRPGSLNGIINQTAVDRYLDQLDTVMPFVREHVGAFVRGRGPVPALRIGRQPYGVLPIVVPGQWRRTDGEPEQLTRLHDVLGVARTFFEPAAAAVPRLHSVADTTTEMVRILGLSPVPHPGAYAVRDVVGRAASIIFLMDQKPPVVANGNESNAELVRSIAASGLMNADITLPAYRYLMALTLGDLVHGTEMEWLALNGVKPMRVSVARTDKDRQGWESPSTYLSRLCHDVIDLFLLVPQQPEERPHDLLFLLAEHALALAGELDSIRILGAANVELFSQAVSVPTEVASTPLPAARAFATAMTSPISEIAGAGIAQQLPTETITAQVFDDAKRAALLGALNLPHEHVNGFAGTRDAIRALADAALSDADYTRLTSETLACASTRLDAWYTSLATQRLETQRAARPTGLQVGAWGILTDVRPRPGTPVAEPPAGWEDSPGHSVTPLPLVSPPQQVGYVHAPSLAQARTAGVLRAGELAHAGDDSTLASLDLTSRRVRLGREVLDALGNGQPLGAVLGYRLERMLADRTMYAEIAALRAAYPQRRTQGDPGAVAAGDDLVVPQEVVDGYEVWQHQTEALAAGATADHRPALQEVISQLDQVVESVADLLVAEGVHQITTGRPESAGATFTAAAEGTPPPDPDVVREPRSGVTLTHRTVVVLDPQGGTPGWTRTAPRATLAPETERWAEDVLGAAADWTISVGGHQVGLDDLDVCALDVIVESRAGAATVPPLHDRLVAAQDDPAATIDDEVFVRLLSLAQAAGEVLARSRPAVPADLVPPAEGTSTDAGTVLAVGRPAASVLRPTASLVASALGVLAKAITAVAEAAQDLDPDTLADTMLDADLITPFRDLGVPGSMQRGAQVSARDALAAASAGAAILRDVDQLIARGLPQQPPPAAKTRAAKLRAVCGTPQAVDSLVAIVRRLGGQAVVPVFKTSNRLGKCAVPDVDALAVEDWLSRMGRVRTNLAAYDDLRLFLEAEGRDLEPLRAFQLPLVPAEGWLADELNPADGKNELRAWTRPSGPRAHVVATGRPALITAAKTAALVVDEVSEVLPSPTVTTGVAAYFDAPSARPPQTILLAVHPDPAQPWGWQLLADTASEALALAKLRAVELDDLAGSGIDEYLPLTYVRDGLPRTTSLSELTKGLVFTLEAMAATRFVEVDR